MSLPYFPMFPTDFEAKTSHLSLAEDGAYNRLLRLMWMTPGCTLPADDAWIMRRMRVDQVAYDAVVKVVIGEFFTVENGRLSNARLARIFYETSDAHDKRVKAGSRGGIAKALATKETTSSNAKAMPKQPEPEPEPDIKKESAIALLGDLPISPRENPQDFEDFWQAYPHRGSKKNKAGAKASFSKAIKAGASVQDIASGVAAMMDDPDVRRGYARDPATWLNQKGWTDEINGNPDRTPPRGSGGGRQAAQRANALADEILAAARAR